MDEASQNLQLIGFRISDGEFRFSFCNWLIILGIVLCPIMWLGSPKNMKYVESNRVFTDGDRNIELHLNFEISDKFSSNLSFLEALHVYRL